MRNYKNYIFTLFILFIVIEIIEAQDLRRFYVRENGVKLYGYLNSKNDTIIKPKFNYASSFSKEGTAIIYKNEKMGKIDSLGGFLIYPDYEYFLDGYSDLIAVRQDGKWGYIDKKLNLVIFFKYKGASNFVNGVASVLTFNDEILRINTNGKVIDKNPVYGEISYENVYSEIESLMKKTINVEQFFNEFRKNITPIWIRSGVEKDYETISRSHSRSGIIYQEWCADYSFSFKVILKSVALGKIIKIFDKHYDLLKESSVRINNSQIEFNSGICFFIVKQLENNDIELTYGCDD